MNTTFMNKLKEQLIVKRGIKPESADIYISNLERVHGYPFKNLTFLKNKQKVMSYINDLKTLSNKLNYLKAISAVLKMYTQDKKYVDEYAYYNKQMDELSEQQQEFNKLNKKTKNQTQNWMEWEEVIDRREELGKEFYSKLNESNNSWIDIWDTLLKYFIISLYTKIAPRRNKDFLHMYVVDKLEDDGNPSKNYLVKDSQELVFNNYKTSQRYGTQRISYDDNEPLKKLINIYLKFHPLKNDKEFPLLVKYDGESLGTNSNSITYILNSVLGKKIGASLLRHIYLSSKYSDDLEAMKNDAHDMGHSLNQARDYIKSS